MSESLNRAFLRAYDKEKTSEAKRQATDEERRSREVAELVTHFDTTSVPIPAPHFLQPKAREQVWAGSATSSQSASDAAAQPVAKPAESKPTPVQDIDQADENNLRDSIALQMLQAGAWEGQRIDAFIGGFPMLSHAMAPSTAPASPTSSVSLTRTPAIAAQQELEQTKELERKGPGVEVFPMAEPTIRGASLVVEAMSQPAHVPNIPEQPLVLTYESQSNEFTVEPTASAAEPAARPTTAAVANPVPSEPVRVEPEAVKLFQVEPARVEALHVEPMRVDVPTPELQSPLAPALTHPPTQPHVINVPVHQPVPTTFENHLAQRSTGGDIFRLDRPSYAQPVKPAVQAGTSAHEASAGTGLDEPEQEDSSDSFSAVDIDRTSTAPQEVVYRTHFAPATGSVSPETTHVASDIAVETSPKYSQRMQPMLEQSRQVEEKLRRARVRIFNPVWEVDSLQWPPVCLELMERMDGSLQHVAENLMTACQEGLQILAVTSPQRGEGTTTVACCLALLAGNHGLNVAIVDGDIEKPSLSYQTNLDVEQDWRSAILHQLPLEEIAVHSIDDQVTLVPLLNPISHHELSADDDRIGLMMQELSESFDLVIIDGGRMDSARSLVTILGERGIINAAVAVVDHRSSTPDRIELCLRRIRQAGIASIGLVENFAA